jgi:hypothetical protein
MTIIYDVNAKRHENCNRPDVCLFYDDDKEKSIDYMSKYCKKHGFSIDEKDGTFTIANLVLRERESTGNAISEIPYRELFDIHEKRLTN